MPDDYVTTNSTGRPAVVELEKDAPERRVWVAIHRAALLIAGAVEEYLGIQPEKSALVARRLK